MILLFILTETKHSPLAEHFKCPVKFERLGCYKDGKQKNKADRPLGAYLLTDRDRGHAVSSGRAIDWHSFDTYLPEFACRCATKTAKKGWNTFGVQYYGEIFCRIR